MGLGALLDRVVLRLLGGAAKAAPGRVPQLDLHGMGVKDALAATERFLGEAQAAGVTDVRIIYGKGRHSPEGRGVLREVVPRWLAAEGARWVASAVPDTDWRGEDAAIRVRLARE